MKKKEFKRKLMLGKKVISSLETDALQGGADAPAQRTTTIIETIKTRRDACTIIATCYCSMTCPEKCGY